MPANYVTLENSVDYSANVVDKDTQTVLRSSGSSCTSTSDEFPDLVGGTWTITQPAKYSIHMGTSASDTAVAWHWSPGIDGDTGATEDMCGGFTFNDGRSDTDSRHDVKNFGSVCLLLLIPDDCRTTYNKPVRGGVPEIRAGDEFWEHIWNPSIMTP
jgi:hypothetical protein